MAKITDPFSNRPVNPCPSGSPLAQTARDFASYIRDLTSVEEQYRSALLTAAQVPVDAPTFTPTLTRAPYETVTPVPQASEPKAGGSKT